MNVRVQEGHYYTEEHEWVKIDGNTARVGISDYAQQKLGDITYIELPEKGKDVNQFEYLTGIESVKAAHDIYSPISGKVLDINNELESNPELINKSPYEDGWIVEIGVNNPDDIDNLLDAKSYKKYVSELE